MEPTTEQPAAVGPQLDPAPETISKSAAIVEAAPQPSSAAPPSVDQLQKPIHSLVLDTGPLIKNDPPIGTLLAQSEELYTIPSVISEIRDEATRSRVETTLLPFLKLRSPRPESVKFCAGFARKTGDLGVLSKPDLHLIALAYELELERNHGDWRLRREPAQKGLNGKPPGQPGDQPVGEKQRAEGGASANADRKVAPEDGTDNANQADMVSDKEVETAAAAMGNINLDQSSPPPPAAAESRITESDSPDVAASEDSDSDGWITPSNLHKHKARDGGAQASPQPIQKTLQVALLTSDYAMQNVLLRMNLNLVSPALSRITHVKTWVLRCHGCYKITRDMAKRFCPSCGQATLTRVSCSTGADGSFRVHLKRNFQFNKRGNIYSIPKPAHGSSSGKIAAGSGGGKNGWGRDLILAEDQKEYTRKAEDERRTKYRDLMDEDYLPGILTGERSGAGGRIKIGAGRNVNSRKR